ncbi:MAG: ABC transporter ATP-binding protein [Erysipelotrichaceae bacterium]|nr:ABC transporter ATP-binding protein [Erysipelotrichaceae bacterium]
MTDQIVLNHVTKTFTTKELGSVTAVEDFNLTVKKGECFSFLGPSGCGKTTTLRMIAGFEDLSSGSIYLGGKLVSDKAKNIYIPPEKRELGMVFQAFAVWPHLNVYENIAFPLKVKKYPKNEIREKVLQAMHYCNLDGLEKTFPSDLSGGQQQRIALARAIVVNPEAMLLDEPLSNLDPHLRETMRFEIKRLQKEFGFTIIFVTHDQSEAMALSDRMLIMDMGKIQQIGTPWELYNNPVNRFVHSFLGQSNFIDVDVVDGKVYPKGERSQQIWIDNKPKKNGEQVLACRPNMMELTKDDGFRCNIIKRTFKTDFVEYLIKIGEDTAIIQAPHRIIFKNGEQCCVKIHNPAWYDKESEDAEKERERRNVV